MKRALFVAVVGAVSLTFIAHAQNGEIRAGRNSNMNPGIVNELIGDPFLQRQVETKHAVSVINNRMVVALSNDYRTVDYALDSGLGEGLFAYFPGLWGLKKFFAAGPPDAWLGLYRSTDGGVSFVNGLVPGFPTDTSPLGLSQPWSGLAAASDGAIASDAYGHFHGGGLFFDRGGRGVIGYFRLTNYNDESRLPIRFDAGFSKAIETTSATANGRFADLPSMIWDAHEPKAGTKGQGGGCGHVYLGYTLFTGAPSNNSAIKFTKSTDCGLTFTVPKSINGKFKANQRVLLFVDPRSGPPKTTGGGTLYAVWTSFEPRQIVLAKSLDFGETWSEPVAVTALSGPSSMCTYDQPTNGVNEVRDAADESARSLAFATGQVGLDGIVTLAWPERVEHDRRLAGFGMPLAAGACLTDGAAAAPPKIVVTRSTNAGVTWTARRAIDMGVRCEARTPNQLGPFDVSMPNAAPGSCPASTVERPAGAQLQPVLSQTAGKMVLLYLEGRADPSRLPNQVLGSTGYHSGRNAQMDVRAADLALSTGQLSKTIQVSQYTLDVNAGDIRQVTGATNPAPPNAKAYSRAYMLQYKGGTISFMGDHNDLAPFEPYVFDSPPRFATAADVPAVKFLGSWGGDNREALFPSGDLFNNTAATLYDPPGSGKPSACNGGARNSNAYAAYIGPRLDAYVNQSFKPLGTIQRSYAVTVRNRSSQPLVIRMAMQEKEGFEGSFDQLQDVDVIGNSNADPFCTGGTYPACTARRTIQPQSSMTFSAFVSSDNAGPVATPVKIYVDDVSNGLCNLGTFTGCDAIIRLNPAPANPAPLAGSNITTTEHHGPSVSGPDVSTHANPTQGNPTQGNPTQGNPTQGNPTQGNAGFSEYTDYTFTVKARDANTISQYSSFANIANPELVDGSHLIQLIITRLQKVPTIDTQTAGCPPTETPEDEVLSIVDVPKAKDLGTPTQGNPTQGNPTQGNPTQGNPTQGNNTYALAPDDAPDSAAARARYRATAIASAVKQALSSVAENIAPDGTVTAQLGPDEVRVTYRFFHCDNPARGTCNIPGRSFQFETPQTETVPRTPGAAADALLEFVTIAGAGDNDNGVISPPKVVSTGGPDLVISFPDSVAVSPTTAGPGEAIDVSGFTVMNQGHTATSGTVRIGLYLSTDSVITSADTLLETFTTSTALQPGGSQFFPFEGDLNSADIPGDVAPGTYFVGYLADDLGQVFELNEANNYVSAASAQLTVVSAPLTITTTSPLPSGIIGFPYPNTQLTATGGVGPYHWTGVPGGPPLPSGLSLSDAGVLSGTPTTFGTFIFSVRVTDSAGVPNIAEKEFTLAVIDVPKLPDLVASSVDLETATGIDNALNASSLFRPPPRADDAHPGRADRRRRPLSGSE
jgi:CARDB